MNQTQCKVSTPIGPLYVTASEKGICGIFRKKQAAPLAQTPLLVRAEKQLQAYFQGNLKEFNLPLDLHGTRFQKRVWNELLKIPFGKTVSYKDIASRIKNAKAVRAVGGANGKNPVCIIVPCHRVIAADGTLGGYSGGLDMKVKLLKLEGMELSASHG